MRPKQVVTSLVSYLDSRLPFAVRTSMQEDDNPRPVVVIDGWVREDDNLHNTYRRGVAKDSNGDIESVVFHHYYNLRVDFKVRAKGEEESYDVANFAEEVFLYLSENPQDLHEDVNEVIFRGSDGANPHHNLESSESSLNLRVDISAFRVIERNADVLETIDSNTEVIN